MYGFNYERVIKQIGDVAKDLGMEFESVTERWNCKQEKSGWVCKLDLPGLGPDDIEVSETNGVISVKVKDDPSLVARLAITEELKVASASMKNGRLTVVLEKQQKASKNLIPVSAG